MHYKKSPKDFTGLSNKALKGNSDFVFKLFQISGCKLTLFCCYSSGRPKEVFKLEFVIGLSVASSMAEVKPRNILPRVKVRVKMRRNCRSSWKICRDRMRNWR